MQQEQIVPEINHEIQPEYYVYETDLRPKLEKYVDIIFERIEREGNLYRIINEVDNKYTVYNAIDLGHGFNLCLKMRIEMDQVCYYIVLDIVNRKQNQNSSRIKLFFVWSHHCESKESEFHPTELDRADMKNMIGITIKRLSRYLPMRLCKDKFCDTLLTTHEKEYCIECESCVGSTQCAICLDEQVVEKLIHTRCGHTFHNKCFQYINEFDHRMVRCPLCRTALHAFTGK